jgi:hypothetical protein
VTPYDGRQVLTTPDGRVLHDANNKPVTPFNLGQHLDESGKVAIDGKGQVLPPGSVQVGGQPAEPAAVAKAADKVAGTPAAAATPNAIDKVATTATAAATAAARPEGTQGALQGAVAKGVEAGAVPAAHTEPVKPVKAAEPAAATPAANGAEVKPVKATEAVAATPAVAQAVKPVKPGEPAAATPAANGAEVKPVKTAEAVAATPAVAQAVKPVVKPAEAGATPAVAQAVKPVVKPGEAGAAAAGAQPDHTVKPVVKPAEAGATPAVAQAVKPVVKPGEAGAAAAGAQPDHTVKPVKTAEVGATPANAQAVKPVVKPGEAGAATPVAKTEPGKTVNPEAGTPQAIAKTGKTGTPEAGTPQTIAKTDVAKTGKTTNPEAGTPQTITKTDVAKTGKSGNPEAGAAQTIAKTEPAKTVKPEAGATQAIAKTEPGKTGNPEAGANNGAHGDQHAATAAVKPAGAEQVKTGETRVQGAVKDDGGSRPANQSANAVARPGETGGHDTGAHGTTPAGHGGEASTPGGKDAAKANGGATGKDGGTAHDGSAHTTAQAAHTGDASTTAARNAARNGATGKDSNANAAQTARTGKPGETQPGIGKDGKPVTTHNAGDVHAASQAAHGTGKPGDNHGTIAVKEAVKDGTAPHGATNVAHAGKAGEVNNPGGKDAKDSTAHGALHANDAHAASQAAHANGKNGDGHETVAVKEASKDGTAPRGTTNVAHAGKQGETASQTGTKDGKDGANNGSKDHGSKDLTNGLANNGSKDFNNGVKGTGKETTGNKNGGKDATNGNNVKDATKDAGIAQSKNQGTLAGKAGDIQPSGGKDGNKDVIKHSTQNDGTKIETGKTTTTKTENANLVQQHAPLNQLDSSKTAKSTDKNSNGSDKDAEPAKYDPNKNPITGNNPNATTAQGNDPNNGANQNANGQQQGAKLDPSVLTGQIPLPGLQLTGSASVPPQAGHVQPTSNGVAVELTNGQWVNIPGGHLVELHNGTFVVESEHGVWVETSHGNYTQITGGHVVGDHIIMSPNGTYVQHSNGEWVNTGYPGVEHSSGSFHSEFGQPTSSWGANFGWFPTDVSANEMNAGFNFNYNGSTYQNDPGYQIPTDQSSYDGSSYSSYTQWDQGINNGVANSNWTDWQYDQVTNLNSDPGYQYTDSNAPYADPSYPTGDSQFPYADPTNSIGQGYSDPISSPDPLAPFAEAIADASGQSLQPGSPQTEPVTDPQPTQSDADSIPSHPHFLTGKIEQDVQTQDQEPNSAATNTESQGQLDGTSDISNNVSPQPLTGEEDNSPYGSPYDNRVDVTFVSATSDDQYVSDNRVDLTNNGADCMTNPQAQYEQQLQEQREREEKERREYQERLQKEREEQERRRQEKLHEAEEQARKLQQLLLAEMNAKKQTVTGGSGIQRRPYVIKSGDTLQSISISQLRQKHLGMLIYQINQAMIPVTVINGKRIPQLKAGMVLMLPNAMDIELFRQHINGGATPDTFSGARLPVAQSSAKASGPNTERRDRIEDILGKLRTAVENDGRVRYTVRLGDTLRSVSLRHAALADVSLWTLLAEVNNLSTQTDATGCPTAKLERGTMIALPTADEIANYRKSHLRRSFAATIS